MFHLELFSSSIATSGANTFQQLTYTSVDNVLPKLNNGMQVSPTLPYLQAVLGVGAHMVHVRGQAPSMLPFPYPALSPNNRGAAFESPPRIWDFSRAPLPLRPTEEFDIFCTQNSGGAETEYVACQFSDGTLTPIPVAINPPGIGQNPTTPGRFFAVHWTAAVTLTAGAFTQVQPVFDQAAGRNVRDDRCARVLRYWTLLPPVPRDATAVAAGWRVRTGIRSTRPGQSARFPAGLPEHDGMGHVAPVLSERSAASGIFLHRGRHRRRRLV